MSKQRPSVDFQNLLDLTSSEAVPMAEASQRTASLPAQPATSPAPSSTVKTANLEALAFKVPPEFRKRFKQRAVGADLKLNELLFAALDAWEEKQGLR